MAQVCTPSALQRMGKYSKNLTADENGRVAKSATRPITMQISTSAALDVPRGKVFLVISVVSANPVSF